MELLDLSLPELPDNLALDEALLEEAEATGNGRETLRFWEASRPMVVLGRNSSIETEVNQQECRRNELPIYRRCSGGASIIAGPGCLMYAVILSYQKRPRLRMIDQAHCHVLSHIEAALKPLLPEVNKQGLSDLTSTGGKKFSGNSLRCCREHLLYHGTLLYDFPLNLIQNCLSIAPREPEYRAGRSHADFVTNICIDQKKLRRALTERWQASQERHDWPQQRTAQLVAEKYSNSDWIMNAKK